MKRIVTCSDGTWFKPNMKEGGKPVKTNVQRMFDFVENKEPKPDGDIIQIKYYGEGVGVGGNFISKIINGATGKGIDDNIKEIYKFICWNYEYGDEIYLFGFSRGAYTARSLAGLIRKSGIIKINDLNLISDAYEFYRNKNYTASSPESISFRNTNSHDISSIKFIGVWDTVGSLGIPNSLFKWYNKKRYTFYDTTLSSTVENAFHALAIDEKRKNFVPTLWEKSQNTTKREFEQKLEQRWFAGVHSNVGGGYSDTGLSDIALKWLVKKAEDAGLYLNKNFDKEFNDEHCKGVLYNSSSGLFSILPKKEREIIINNKDSFIDESVYKRMELLGKDYQPANVINAKKTD